MKNINGLMVLEKSDFLKHCPSFYAEQPHDRMSERYTFLNSREIAVQLWNNGWYPTMAREMRSNKKENRGFTKHLVRFSNPHFVTTSGDRIELVSVNSHNGVSAYQFFCGVFRLVCSNGMIAQTSDLGSFRVLHKGDIVQQVQMAIDGISNNASLVAESMQDMQTIELTPNEQGIFASAAHAYLYDEPEAAPIRPQSLLIPRRTVDDKSDLWSVFNRVQENALKGGLKGFNHETRRRVKTKKLTSIDKDIKINKALWQLAEKMREMKKAA